MRAGFYCCFVAVVKTLSSVRRLAFNDVSTNKCLLECSCPRRCRRLPRLHEGSCGCLGHGDKPLDQRVTAKRTTSCLWLLLCAGINPSECFSASLSVSSVDLLLCDAKGVRECIDTTFTVPRAPGRVRACLLSRLSQWPVPPETVWIRERS